MALLACRAPRSVCVVNMRSRLFNTLVASRPFKHTIVDIGQFLGVGSLTLRCCRHRALLRLLVRNFRYVDRDGVFTGPPLVAKESRFEEEPGQTEGDKGLGFHFTFCNSQNGIVSCSRLQVPGSRLQAPGSRLQAPGSSQASDLSVKPYFIITGRGEGFAGGGGNSQRVTEGVDSQAEGTNSHNIKRGVLTCRSAPSPKMTRFIACTQSV
eukprot:1190234-Prorocentrum_minimum.AAC.4